MGSVESSPPGHPKGGGGEAGVESGRFEGPLSIDDAERFAATFRPSWEFDEAPFAAGPALTPAEFQSLSASEHPRALPITAEAEVPLVARSVPPRAPPSRNDAAPPANEASVIVEPPAPAAAPEAPPPAVEVLAPVPLDMAPPPRVAAGLGLPAAAPRVSAAPSSASLASTVTNGAFPRNVSAARPAFDSLAPVSPKKKTPLVVGGVVVALAAAFFAYRAVNSGDDTAAPAVGTASPAASSTSASSAYGSGSSVGGSVIPTATGVPTAPPTPSQEDLTAALGTRPASSANTAGAFAKPTAPPPAPTLHPLPPVRPPAPVVHAPPVQRAAPPPHEAPKSPPKPTGGGIVRDVPF